MHRTALAGAAVLLATPAGAAQHVVTMQGQAYAPAAIVATPGDAIRFVNDDTSDHEVFVPTVGFGIDLGKQEPAQEKILNLARPGAFEVECVFHPEMLLTVTVK